MKTTDSIQKTFYATTLGEDNVVALERKSVEPDMPNTCQILVSKFRPSTIVPCTF